MRLGPAIKLIPARISAQIPALILALILIAIAPFVAAQESPRAQYLGSYSWTMDRPWFGGWSGIELSPDGRQMTAINDRGRLLRGEIERDGDRITAVITAGVWRLRASTGRFLTGGISDSEGLAIGPDGTIHISFEGVTRVAAHSRPQTPARVLRRHRDFRGFARNKSLEALAVDRAGRLFAIPERLEDDGLIRVYVHEGAGWSIPMSLNGKERFLPVGADFGPDGRFYLLERAWGVLGFRTRIRRWDLVGDTAQNEELLVLTGYGTHDNLEGLAVWRDQGGRIRLTLVADDNFLSFQRSEIVEYAVQE